MVKLSHAFSLLDENRKRNLIKLYISFFTFTLLFEALLDLISLLEKNFGPNEDELTKFYTIKSTTIQDPKNHEY
jgi:hypothetical protein